MANTTNFNWETPDDTDLVKDGAAAIRTLGSAIDTSLVDLKGGTTGQVLSKATNADMDFTWVAQDDSNAIQNAIVDAKGDIVAASAADTPARLAVGTDNQRLVAASGEATGLKYVSDTQNTVIDAAGDLLYGTAADTVARLAIGTAGQVLTVNSGATAPQWATPAGGGGMTSIASGSLSGASLDLTTISGSYKDLVLILRAATPANDTSVIGRLNNDSTGIYNYISNRQSGGTYSTDSANTATSFPITSATGQNPQSGALVMTIFDYANSTGHKQVQLQYNFTQNTGAICNNFVAGAYRSTTAISRITLTPGSGNWSSGTYILYGVN